MTEPVTETIEKQPERSNIHDEIRKLKTLIVEDDEASEMLLDETVRIFSMDTLKARTGVEAIKVCRDNPDIDLILMDVKMPGMDGEEATRQIRKFNKDVVIIAQTAKALIGDKQTMLDAGCNDYITKPINKDELYALIEKYFGE